MRYLWLPKYFSLTCRKDITMVTFWISSIWGRACLWAGGAYWVFRNLPLSVVWPKNCRKEKTWTSIVAVDLNSIVIVSSIMSWWFSWRWSWFLPEQSWPFPASVTQGQAQSISQARDRVPGWFSPWTISWSYLYFQGGFHKHVVTLSKCYITGRDRSLLVANITPYLSANYFRSTNTKNPSNVCSKWNMYKKATPVIGKVAN